MPPKKHGTLWPAPPHTVAKLQILSGYLKAYFPILGRTRPREEILIIDGFAGPGEYLNHAQGSPLAALETASEALAGAGGEWRAGNIHLAFIEKDRKRFEHLQNKIEELRATLPNRVVPHLYNATFANGLEQIKKDVPQPFASRQPLFVFIDPFGATGAPFAIVSELLQSPCSEVLINLDADGIARILKAGEHAKRDENLTLIFGDESWKEALTATSFSMQCRQIRELYLQRLRSLPRVKYVYSFAMHKTQSSINYDLVFASQHHLGLEKMKEAMKALGQDGSFVFSDDRHRSEQPSMFRFDDIEEYAPLMHKHFSGKQATYAEARDYALNYTPFVNPKKCLAFLENDGQLTVEAKNPKRRRGTFAEDDIIKINFRPFSPSLF